MQKSFGQMDRGPYLDEGKRMELLKRLGENRPKVFEFDHSVSGGKLPSPQTFREISLTRAQDIRDENTLTPSNLSDALIIDAQRLEEAAQGDGTELAAEALRTADFYKWMDFDTKTKKPTGKYQTAIDTWTKLAESILAEKRNQEQKS